MKTLVKNLVHPLQSWCHTILCCSIFHSGNDQKIVSIHAKNGAIPYDFSCKFWTKTIFLIHAMTASIVQLFLVFDVFYMWIDRRKTINLVIRVNGGCSIGVCSNIHIHVHSQSPVEPIKMEIAYIITVKIQLSHPYSSKIGVFHPFWTIFHAKKHHSKTNPDNNTSSLFGPFSMPRCSIFCIKMSKIWY